MGVVGVRGGVFGLVVGCGLWFVVLLVGCVSAFAVLPEVPVTEVAGGVSAGGALLRGELNPGVGVERVAYHFVYSVGPECAVSGLTAPAAAPFPTAEGNHQKVSQALAGLEGSTEYSVCLVAANPVEEAEASLGTSQSFQTLAASPVVVSESSSGVTPFGVVLQAEVNPENQPTVSCVFEYGKLLVSEATRECEPASLEGPSVQPVSAAVTGLEAATKYHYRVVVKNATGETNGVEGSFTTATLQAPIVGVQGLSGLTGTGATLEAVINPNYQETTYGFEYATNEALTGATIVPGAGPLAAEFAEVPVSVPVGGLTPRTTYYYRVAATNGAGTTRGAAVQRFTTLASPLADTGGVEHVTRTSAGLLGGVNPAGAATSYHFVYVEAAGYLPGAGECLQGQACAYAQGGKTVTATAGAGYSEQAAGPLAATGLRPGVTYHYALVAENSLGSVTGADQTFTTSPPAPPLASTGGAEGISQLAATITGSIETGGLPTSVRFELGLTPQTASVMPANISSTGAVGLAAHATLENDLQPATTYYYRVLASNPDGTSYGAWQTFTTTAFPAVFPSATLPAILPYTPIATLNAREAKETRTVTKAEKLAKALKACRTKKNRHKRTTCEKNAHAHAHKTH